MTTTDLAGSATPCRGLIRVVPNLLTSARLVIGLLFPFLEADTRWIALLIGRATEFLDGQVARLLQVPSTTGQMLDPIYEVLPGPDPRGKRPIISHGGTGYPWAPSTHRCHLSR